MSSESTRAAGPAPEPPALCTSCFSSSLCPGSLSSAEMPGLWGCASSGVNQVCLAKTLFEAHCVGVVFYIEQQSQRLLPLRPVLTGH